MTAVPTDTPEPIQLFGVGIISEVGFIFIQYDPVTEATSSLAYGYDVPAGSLVGAASVTVTAEPAGRTAIENVGRVRAADGALATTKQLVVDFGGLRTVSSVTAPSALTAVRPWTGTSFATDSLVPSVSTSDETFTEVATERLLVEVAAATTPGAFAETGRVTLHDPPADVELLVGGERVHIEPGPVRGEHARLERTIDITAAVQRSVDAGVVPVPLELRSSVPANLSIAPGPGAHVLAHAVAFSEGARRTVSTADEGVFTVELPLPPESDGWRIRQLRFDLQGDVGDRRVIPADGPAVAPGAEVVVDVDRPLAIRLPASTVRSLPVVDAVRLLVRPETAGELGGHLAPEVSGPGGELVPGEPLADAALVATPVEVAPTSGWVTLPLARPVSLDPEEGVWVVVHAARGRVVLPLAVPSTAPPGGAPAVDVVRLASNGRYRPLPAVTGIDTTAVPIRIGGVPVPTAPVPAVEVVVDGSGLDPIRLTPESTPQSFELAFDPPLVPADGHLDVHLTITGPGDHTIGPVVVGYEVAS